MRSLLKLQKRVQKRIRYSLDAQVQMAFIIETSNLRIVRQVLRLSIEYNSEGSLYL